MERVDTNGFLARLTPIRTGGDAADPTVTEYTEFGYDEIATQDDFELIQPGAVFYWTLGKRTSEAGTIMNDSLVRFRRLPSPGLFQRRLAREEANRIFDAVSADDDERPT